MEQKVLQQNSQDNKPKEIDKESKQPYKGRFTLKP
jgi:hypothetical protein